MVSGISFILPAMQFTCHLVALSTIINSVPVLTYSEPPHRANDQLPDGYVAFPNIGIAYKYHYHSETWPQAMKVCHQNGAKLAVIDSAEKIQAIKSWGLPRAHMHAGINRLDSKNWMNVNTICRTSEPPLSPLTWRTGYPVETTDCACFHPDYAGVMNCWCNFALPFLCEIPYRSSFTIAAN